MGCALVGISPRSAPGISWRNQFIGNLWGVRSGRLIPGDQVLSVLATRGLSDSRVNTYRDDGAPADRRLLTRHGRRDKYRTPINSPPFFAPRGPTSREETGFRGRRADLLRRGDLPWSKASRPNARRLSTPPSPKSRSRTTTPARACALPPT